MRKLVVEVDCGEEHCGACALTARGCPFGGPVFDLSNTLMRSDGCRHAEQAPAVRHGEMPWTWMAWRWNRMVDELVAAHGDQAGPVRMLRWTDGRKRAAGARLAASPDVQAAWEEACRLVQASPFLSRRQTSGEHRGWRPDVDWLLRDSSWTKLHEGKYAPARQDPGSVAWPAAPAPAMGRQAAPVSPAAPVVDMEQRQDMADRIRQFRRGLGMIGTGGGH